MSEKAKSTNPPKAADQEELNEILDQLHENPNPKPKVEETESRAEEIIRKPSGSLDQPEDLEGLLDKISEDPEKNRKSSGGFFQKLLSFFKRS